jgi:hypothetical protein
VGRAIAGRRAGVVLATKFGFRLDGEPEDRRINGAPAYARQKLEESLRRLRVDHVDLYYLHRVDPLVPIEDTVAELTRLKEEGKIGAIGLSKLTPPRCAAPMRCIRSPRYKANIRCGNAMSKLKSCRRRRNWAWSLSPIARWGVDSWQATCRRTRETGAIVTRAISKTPSLQTPAVSLPWRA